MNKKPLFLRKKWDEYLTYINNPRSSEDTRFDGQIIYINDKNVYAKLHYISNTNKYVGILFHEDYGWGKNISQDELSSIPNLVPGLFIVNKGNDYSLLFHSEDNSFIELASISGGSSSIVKSVNSILPDSNGNILIDAEDINTVLNGNTLTIQEALQQLWNRNANISINNRTSNKYYIEGENNISVATSDASDGVLLKISYTGKDKFLTSVVGEITDEGYKQTFSIGDSSDDDVISTIPFAATSGGLLSTKDQDFYGIKKFNNIPVFNEGIQLTSDKKINFKSEYIDVSLYLGSLTSVQKESGVIYEDFNNHVLKMLLDENSIIDCGDWV